MGDFNIDLLKIESHKDSNDFFNTISSHFFTPFVLQPTRLASKTLIDNIFFNSLEYQSNSGNLLIQLSDHLIQFLILDGFIKERALPKSNIFKRDFSYFNEREFLEVINSMDWESICAIQNGNANASFNDFYNSIIYYLDEFAPYKKVTKNELKLMLKPWISNEILQQCKVRDNLLRQVSKEKNL